MEDKEQLLQANNQKLKKLMDNLTEDDINKCLFNYFLGTKENPETHFFDLNNFFRILNFLHATFKVGQTTEGKPILLGKAPYIGLLFFKNDYHFWKLFNKKLPKDTIYSDKVDYYNSRDRYIKYLERTGKLSTFDSLKDFYSSNLLTKRLKTKVTRDFKKTVEQQTFSTKLPEDQDLFLKLKNIFLRLFKDKLTSKA